MPLLVRYSYLKNKSINCSDKIGVFSRINPGIVEFVNIAIFHSGSGNTVTKYKTTNINK